MGDATEGAVARTRTGFRRRWALAAAALAVALAAPGTQAWGAPGRAAASPAATASATVSVDAGSTGATVPATAIGLNGSVYDADLTDAAVPGLLKAAGTGLIRFPGGSSSDEYDWKTNTDVVSHSVQATDFDQYATLLQQTGAQGMITVNYGAAWEPDAHCSTSSSPTDCGPAVYAQNVKAYIAAMKAVDPGIVVGVVLTAPGDWPDGQTSAGSPQPWNQTVTGSVDFGFQGTWSAGDPPPTTFTVNGAPCTTG